MSKQEPIPLTQVSHQTQVLQQSWNKMNKRQSNQKRSNNFNRDQNNRDSVKIEASPN